MRKTFFASPKSVRYRTPLLKSSHPLEASVSARQEKIEGFKQSALENTEVFVAGGGGIGSYIDQALVRKGVGHLVQCDPDIVDPSNLNRQLYYKKDLFKNKALCLAKNLAKEGMLGTRITGYAASFEELVAGGVDLTCDVAIIGVDNDQCRIACSQYFLERRIPVIFIAVDVWADHGSVFIQESKPDTPCFGCLHPDAVKNPSWNRCPTAAAPDILLMVAGAAVYAVDTIVMQRKRNWIYRDFFLSGLGEDGSRNIPKRPDCPICGSGKSGN